MSRPPVQGNTVVVGGKYEIDLNQVIGRGRDGIVYSGKITGRGEYIAAKVERRTEQDLPALKSTLQREHFVYRSLNRDGNRPGIPNHYCFGISPLFDGPPRRMLIF